MGTRFLVRVTTQIRIQLELDLQRIRLVLVLWYSSSIQGVDTDRTVDSSQTLKSCGNDSSLLPRVLRLFGQRMVSLRPSAGYKIREESEKNKSRTQQTSDSGKIR